MQIVGIEDLDHDGPQVHTIDIWFSKKRGAWILERLDAQGHQVGSAHACADEHEASACLGEWLRAHDDTYLVAPRALDAAEKRVLAEAAGPRRKAA